MNDTIGPDYQQQWEDYCAMKDAEQAEVTPDGLRMRASMCCEPASDGTSTATHLLMAAEEIERLQWQVASRDKIILKLRGYLQTIALYLGVDTINATENKKPTP